jgi:hypothetical protein
MDEVDKVWNGGLGEKLGGLVRRPFACSIEGLDSTDSCVARIGKEDTMLFLNLLAWSRRVY